MQTKLKLIAKHLLFWVVFFLYEWLAYSSVAAQDGCFVGNPYKIELYYALAYVPLLMSLVYFVIYVAIERFLLSKQYYKFGALLVGSLFSLAVIYRVLTFTLIVPLYRPDLYRTSSLFFFPKILITMFDFGTLVGVAVMLYFVNKWYQQQKLTQQLQLSKREAELELLKSQVHPHFIFNTLNNIYSLSLKNSPQTSDMIYRLSSLLDYMLYDSKSGQIPLKHELEYIGNYIDLQKIRYCADQLNIQLNINPQVEKLYIAPLLLLPFVENCFKHGVSQQMGKSWIRIDIAPKNDQLHIVIENSKADDVPPMLEKSDLPRSGIGLENIKRRLAILYKDQHTLAIENGKDQFAVRLTFELAALNRSDVHEPTQPLAFA